VAAKKGPVWGGFLHWLLQGLKPNVDLMGFSGPTEVVPLLLNLGAWAPMSFPQGAKPARFHAKALSEAI
jgi:spore maturation protein SpmB